MRNERHYVKVGIALLSSGVTSRFAGGGVPEAGQPTSDGRLVFVAKFGGESFGLLEQGQRFAETTCHVDQDGPRERSADPLRPEASGVVLGQEPVNSRHGVVRSPAELPHPRQIAQQRQTDVGLVEAPVQRRSEVVMESFDLRYHPVQVKRGPIRLQPAQVPAGMGVAQRI